MQNNFEKQAADMIRGIKANRLRMWMPNFRLSLEISYVVLQFTLLFMRLDQKRFDWIAFRWKVGKITGEAALYWEL